MRVYLVRHGESETNAAGVWAGWMDAELTKKGKADAVTARKFLEHISFDKIYASDLKRAIRTAQIALPERQYETSELLREINVGDLAGKPLPVMTEEQRDIVKKSGYEMFHGESQEHFSNRVSQFKKMLEGLDCDTVAVFSHAGWLKNFLNSVFELCGLQAHIFCGNCAIAVFEYKDSTWKLLNWINPSTIF